MPEGRKRENQQAQRAGNFNKQAQGDNQPAIELVGNEPRDQHQQQRRQKLRQAHKAKIKRIAGQIINLPPTATDMICTAKPAAPKAAR